MLPLRLCVLSYRVKCVRMDVAIEPQNMIWSIGPINGPQALTMPRLHSTAIHIPALTEVPGMGQSGSFDLVIIYDVEAYRLHRLH